MKERTTKEKVSWRPSSSPRPLSAPSRRSPHLGSVVKRHSGSAGGGGGDGREEENAEGGAEHCGWAEGQRGWETAPEKRVAPLTGQGMRKGIAARDRERRIRRKERMEADEGQGR